MATSEAPDLAGARMGRAATDRAAVAGENPAGARVWAGGADGCADDWYHHCLGEGDGTRRPAQERQAGRDAGCRAGGEGTREDGRVWEVGTDTARAQARASRPLRRRRKRERERQRGRACGRECGPHTAANVRTDRWERTGQVMDNGTPDHTDTVKGMTWPPVVMPSASLVCRFSQFRPVLACFGPEKIL